MSENLLTKPETVPSQPARAADSRLRRLVWRAIPALILVASVVWMVTTDSRQSIGFAAIVLMLTLMGLRVPIGVAMALPGVLGLWVMLGWTPAEGMLRRMPFTAVASWQLTIIPMFVIMGTLLHHSGVTMRLYDAARQWLGWLPGGLAIGTNVAGAGFAALSGSTIGTIYPLARSGIPEMIRAGYNTRLTVGAVMKAGTLAHLIPPSLFLVLYAGVAQVSIGPQLMAGIGPGLLLLLMFVVSFAGICLIRPSLEGEGRRAVRTSWSGRFRSLGATWPPIALIVVVITGIYSGWVTVTEAAALGALGALLITVFAQLRSGKAGRIILSAAVESLASVGAIFFLIIGATIFSRLLAVSGVAKVIVEPLASADLSRVQFLMLLCVAYLFLGMFLEPLAMMLLTVPLLLPLLDDHGISPIWFGVFIVIFMELAVVTPPVGLLTYVVHSIVQDPRVNLGRHISLKDVFLSVIYLIPVPILLIAIMAAWPELVTWIPDNMITRP